ncbi:MAG: GNAT family N-acetyltransferase [Prosthecobacter sp.]|nr:GNAT family N-acetyltransferase [Prosthecobacter sp.]
MSTSDTHPSLIEALRPKLVPCRIREFHADDLEACLDIHRSNEPDLLDPSGLGTVVEFLAHGTSYVLVVEQAGKVVACAGLELVGDANAAKLIHAMVHRDYQHRGIGTTLLAARLSLLEPEEDEPVQVLLRARPAAAAFYGGFGFALHTLEREQGSAILRLIVTPDDIESLRAEFAQRGIEIELNPLEESQAEDVPEGE